MSASVLSPTFAFMGFASLMRVLIGDIRLDSFSRDAAGCADVVTSRPEPFGVKLLQLGKFHLEPSGGDTLENIDDVGRTSSL
jgi:hypothetical protein